jgi:hypothetical protein
MKTFLPSFLLLALISLTCEWDDVAVETLKFRKLKLSFGFFASFALDEFIFWRMGDFDLKSLTWIQILDKSSYLKLGTGFYANPIHPILLYLT